MPKKIVNLRRTNRFRYIQQPQSMRPGPTGIKWSSCNSTMNPGQGKGGGGSPVFQTATGVTYLGWRYQRAGLKAIVDSIASTITTGFNPVKLLSGAALFAHGSTMTAKFTRPCSEQDDNRNLF